MPVGDAPSSLARAVAEHAVARYLDPTIATLAELVAFRTVAAPPTPNMEHLEFQRMKRYLGQQARALELDFEDHGAAVVVGLGRSADRLGVLTHGDVQPADAARWTSDPFCLDATSEPGRLVGRGVEDDKGSVATALYAMKAVRDQSLALHRRIELVISMAEEWDWGPFRRFLTSWSPPGLNVALDAKYPVVTGEKGSGTIILRLARADENPPGPALLTAITGGAFRTQVPGEAEAVIESAEPRLATELRRAVDPSWKVVFDFSRRNQNLHVRAHGHAVHSSVPWEGRNAITHLAALLGTRAWPPTQAAWMVRLINDLIDIGHYGERFGRLAHRHDFMGSLTLSLTTLALDEDGHLVATLNVRRPVGRSLEDVETTIRDTLDGWKVRTGCERLDYTLDIGEPYYVEAAPHVPVLLSVFRFYTGDPEAGPVSIGGGTQARLLPNGVNFGPSMPGVTYTGHSDHEFVTLDQLKLNLRMCAAMLAELAAS